MEDKTKQSNADRLLEARMAALNQFAIIAETDPQGRITYVNDQFCKISQYSREELLGQDHRLINSGYHPKSFFKNMWATIGVGKIWQGEVRNKAKDGSFYWVNTTIVPFMDSHGKPEKYLVLRVVVTELKAAEEKLKSMAASIPGMVYEFSLDKAGSMKLHYVNEFCKELLGLEPQDFLNDFSLMWNCILPEDREGVAKSIYASAEKLEPWSSEFRILDAHGNMRYVQGNSIPEKPRFDGTIHWHGVLLDVSSRKLLEEQFLRAQKMEAVGHLAGGVAHDFNNLLTVINGYSEMLLAKLSDEDRMRSPIDAILKAGVRAKNLTGQLLAFSRQQVYTPKVTELNALISDVEKMLHRLIGEDIELVFEAAPDLWPIKVDPSQIEQVLVNLAVNSRDALPQGGRITIRSQNTVLGVNQTAGEVPDGDYVQLSLSDNGTGMSAEVMEHIFEPFFTTKEKGKGTGLGLATCFGIIKRSNGMVRVSSTLEIGTTFDIYFPRSGEAPESLTSQEKWEELPTGTETILLAEDEAAVREMTAEILIKQGYQVLQAENGKAALSLLQTKKNINVRLVITDVVMPVMSGGELSEQMRVLFPGIKILFISGYTDDQAIHHGVEVEQTNFLQKPFTVAALAFKVRQVLDA